MTIVLGALVALIIVRAVWLARPSIGRGRHAVTADARLYCLVVLAAIVTLRLVAGSTPGAAPRLAFLEFIVTAIEFVIGVIGDIGAAIAVALQAVVGWLVTTVGWLISTLKNVAIGAGQIFAKVWDGVKIVWNDVLKPVIGWIDDAVKNVRKWLVDTLGPVFDFLRTVRDEVRKIYDRFVKPVLGVIDFVHKLDQLLQVFHIHLLDKLDTTLQQIERRIDGAVFFLYGRIAEIFNVLTLIVTADGFFQRYIHLRSLARDVAHHWNILTNSRMRELTEYEQARLHRSTTSTSPKEMVSGLGAYWDGHGEDLTVSIDAQVSRAVGVWDSFG